MFCDRLPLLVLLHSNASKESDNMTLRFVVVGTLDNARLTLLEIDMAIALAVLYMPILIVLDTSSSSSLVLIEVCEFLTFHFATTCTRTAIIVTKRKNQTCKLH